VSRESDPDIRLAQAIREDGPVIVPFGLDLQPGRIAPGPPADLPRALAKAAYGRVRGATPIICPWSRDCECRWSRSPPMVCWRM